MYCLKNSLFKWLIFCSFITITIPFNQLSAEVTSTPGIQAKINSNETGSLQDKEIAYRGRAYSRGNGLKFRGYQRNYNGRYDRDARYDRYGRYRVDDRFDRGFGRYYRYNKYNDPGLSIAYDVAIYNYYPYYYSQSYYNPYPYKDNTYVYPDYSSYFDEYYYTDPDDTIYYYSP